MMIEGGTSDQTDIQWPDAESDPQMRKTDPTIRERTYRGYRVKAFVTGEAILVGLLGELIGVDRNVEPV